MLEPPGIAVVLSGGGARGAYEAGALSVLLPEIERRGERVDLWCGTSVGAINAALFASLADREASDQVERALAHWRGMRKGHVVAPILGPRLPLMGARIAAEALGLPLRLASLLDPAPLRASIDRWVDWDALHANVRRGRGLAVAVVATSLSQGQPVVFLEARRAIKPVHGRALRYVRTRLGGEHLRASAAIPFVFPPVEITAPRAAADHYVDGGTRLNTPLKPALELGAQRILVIAVEPPFAAARPPRRRRRPNLADVASNVIDGLLVDQVADDLQRMTAINSFMAEGVAVGLRPGARGYRRARGRSPYRKVPYALVAPTARGELGRLAETVLASRYGGLRGVRSPDYLLLSRVLSGSARGRGELLSFLLFDPTFVELLIEAGKRDASRWLEHNPALWSTSLASDGAIDHTALAAIEEERLLEEWRTERRRA